MCNGYPNNVIKKIFHYNEENNKKKDNKEKTFIPLQYDETLESNLKNIICNDEIGLAWKQKTKILDIYKNNKLPTKNENLKNVVYIIPCSCGNIYIGETGRPFRVRVKEHMANVRLQRQQSKIYLHLEKNTGHDILWQNAFILDIEVNNKLRKLKEGMLIDLNKNNCISDKTVETQKSWEWLLHKFKVKKTYYGTELFVV